MKTDQKDIEVIEPEVVKNTKTGCGNILPMINTECHPGLNSVEKIKFNTVTKEVFQNDVLIGLGEYDPENKTIKITPL